MSCVLNCFNPFAIELHDQNNADSIPRAIASILPGIGLIMYPVNMCHVRHFMPAGSEDNGATSIMHKCDDLFAKTRRYHKSALVSALLTLIAGVALLALGMATAGIAITSTTGIAMLAIAILGTCFRMQESSAKHNLIAHLPSDDIYMKKLKKQCIDNALKAMGKVKLGKSKLQQLPEESWDPAKLANVKKLLAIWEKRADISKLPVDWQSEIMDAWHKQEAAALAAQEPAAAI